MADYVLTGKAEQDLADIIDYTRAHWDRAQTSRYITSIEEACQLLADNPGIGKDCDDIARGLLSHPAESHVIYYLRQDEGIAVLRVLHQRMLPGKHL